jgi:membrane protease subunit (stomatin/prohibitin family)
MEIQMNIKLVNLLSKEQENVKVIKCNDLNNDIIFMKYDVVLGDVIELDDNQYVVLIEKGTVYDAKENSGLYIVMNEIIDSDEDVKEEWKDLKIRKTDNDGLCVVFLNKNLIEHNKYIINDPIKYIDWKDGNSREVYIKVEGFYDFKIEDPKKLLSQVIGLRAHFSKQELIEKIRKFIINSIEKGINEVSEEYKLDIDNLVSESKKLGIEINQNEYDEKLLEYGVKITYFDISNFEISKKKNKIF